MKSLRNLISRTANTAMLDQETDNTETSNQIDISVASSSKQEDKTKKPNQGLKRSIQIEQEEINEGETQEELEEITGQSDPLNLVFSYFDSRFKEIQNQIRKNKDNEPAGKKRKIQVETFKQKGHRLQHEFNKDIMEDLQDIIDNISDEQDPVSTSLKAVISKLKKRDKLIKIADSTEGGWVVVAEYKKEPIWSDSDDCKRIRQAETRPPKNKNKGKSKSSALKPSSTLRNPRIGQQFCNAEFKHDSATTSSDNRQYPFQYRPNLYPQHPNSSQSWKPWRETETADYCFGCGEQGHWRWTCPKRKQSYYRR